MLRRAALAAGLVLLAAGILGFAIRDFNRPMFPTADTTTKRDHDPGEARTAPRVDEAGTEVVAEKWLGSVDIDQRSSDEPPRSYRSRVEMSLFASGSGRGDGLLTLPSDAEDAPPFQYDLLRVTTVGQYVAFVATGRFPDVMDTYVFCGAPKDGSLRGPALSDYAVPLGRGYVYGLGTGTVTMELADGGTHTSQPTEVGGSTFAGEWAGPVEMSTTNWDGRVRPEKFSAKLLILDDGKDGLGGRLTLTPLAENAKATEYALSRVHVAGSELSFVATPKSTDVYEAYAIAGAIEQNAFEGALVRLYVAVQDDSNISYTYSTGSVKLVRQ